MTHETEYEKRNFWMGQLYDAPSDRHFGSMYDNEMDFHMFTRTRDGFCDKCDLDPEGRFDDDGYRLPGHLFHSRASEFTSTYFQNWQSEDLFTDITPSDDILYDVFRFDNTGNFIKNILTPRNQLRFLAGTLKATEEFKNFLTCKDAKVGMTIFNGSWAFTIPRLLPRRFVLRLNEEEMNLLPTHAVIGTLYGYKLLIRFDCDYDRIDNLCRDLNVLIKCLDKEEDPIVLDELPRYKVWIGPASVDNTSRVLNPLFLPLRVIYNNIRSYINDVLTFNSGKGLSMKQDIQALNTCPNFSFDAGNRSRNVPALLNKLPKSYGVNETYNFSKCKPRVLLKDILETTINLRRSKIVDAKNLTFDFEAALQMFQQKLLSALFRNDIQAESIRFIQEVILQYEYSRCSPKRINQLLDNMTESDEETIKFKFLSKLIRKGVKFLPNCSLMEEYVVLEFGNFALSRIQESWKANVDFFTSLISESKIEGRKRNYYIEELDISDGRILVKHFNQSEIISNDMLGDYCSRDKGSKPLFIAEYIYTLGRHNSEYSNAVLGLPCPASRQGGCQFSYNRWFCNKCLELLKYHESKDMVICRCGGTPLINCFFSCSQENHGWIPFSPLANMNPFKPRKEFTVLLLGESGTGKSTFINSLFNCLSFWNPLDAIVNAPPYVIPTAFNKEIDGSVQTVPYGEDENEEMTDGRTRTLNCRSYVFPLDETRVIRFIDTPGFPSTDYLPFLASVLNQAKQFTLINAFCFVLKSTDSELSEEFKSVFHILLKTLVPNSFKNVFFLITHFNNNEMNIAFQEDLLNLWKNSHEQKMMSKAELPFIIKVNNIFPYLIENFKQRLDSFTETDLYQSAWVGSKYAGDTLIDHVSGLQLIDPAMKLRYEEIYWTKLEDIFCSKDKLLEMDPSKSDAEGETSTKPDEPPVEMNLLTSNAACEALPKPAEQPSGMAPSTSDAGCETSTKPEAPPVEMDSATSDAGCETSTKPDEPPVEMDPSTSDAGCEALEKPDEKPSETDLSTSDTGCEASPKRTPQRVTQGASPNKRSRAKHRRRKKNS